MLPVRTPQCFSQKATNDHISPANLSDTIKKRGFNSSSLPQQLPSFQRRWCHSWEGKQDTPGITMGVCKRWPMPQMNGTATLWLIYTSIIKSQVQEKVHNIQPDKIFPRHVNYLHTCQICWSKCSQHLGETNLPFTSWKRRDENRKYSSTLCLLCPHRACLLPNWCPKKHPALWQHSPH